jgi:hypothetical protein
MNDNDKQRDSERDELTREFSIEIDRTELDARAASARDDGTLPIAISSEYPVLRDSYWEDGRYYEVLVHSKDASISRGEGRTALPRFSTTRTRARRSSASSRTSSSATTASSAAT